MAKAPEKNTANDALGAAMKRREVKLAALVAEAEVNAKKLKAAPKTKPAPQDHRPPAIGAKEVMAGFEHSMEIVRARRLQELARKHPEVAKLMEAARPDAHKQPEPAPDFESNVIPAV